MTKPNFIRASNHRQNVSKGSVLASVIVGFLVLGLLLFGTARNTGHPFSQGDTSSWTFTSFPECDVSSIQPQVDYNLLVSDRGNSEGRINKVDTDSAIEFHGIPRPTADVSSFVVSSYCLPYISRKAVQLCCLLVDIPPPSFTVHS